MNEQLISSLVFLGGNSFSNFSCTQGQEGIFLNKVICCLYPRKQWFIHRVLRFPICRRSPFSIPEPYQGQLEASHFETRPSSPTSAQVPGSPTRNPATSLLDQPHSPGGRHQKQEKLQSCSLWNEDRKHIKLSKIS